MKKLFIFVFILGVIYGDKIFAVDCSVQKAAIDNAQKNLDNAKKVLCGTYKDSSGKDQLAYSDMACNDKAALDFQSDPTTNLKGYNVWGGFRKACDSDQGDLSGSGMCLYYDPSPDKYKFIYSAQTEPPLRKFCATGNISCPADGYKSSGWTAGHLFHGTQRLEKKWLRKYDGYGGQGVPKHKVQHHTNDSSETSDMTDEQKEDALDNEGCAPDKDRGTNCEKLCIMYWNTVESIPGLAQTLQDAQDAYAALDCGPIIPECNDECKCSGAGGKWDAKSKKCSCQDLGSKEKYNSCICTTGSPPGLWQNGKCLPKGNSTEIKYDDNTSGGGSSSSTDSSTSDNSSGTSSVPSSDSGGAGSSGGLSAGLGSVGGGYGGSAKSAAGGMSGKSWYDDFKSVVGLSRSSKSSGGTASTFSGSSGGSSKDNNRKMGATQGFSPSTTDIFAVVKVIHEQQYTKGSVGEPTNIGNSGSPVKKAGPKRGSKPVIYDNAGG